MRNFRLIKTSFIYMITFSIAIIAILSISGCKKTEQTDNTETQMIETEGDIEIIIPEDQDSEGF